MSEFEPAPQPRRGRTTESPMAMPTLGRAMKLFGRAARLRCPHCGAGKVLGRLGKVRERCSGCGFRFERSDDNYFMGALFFNFLIGSGSVLVGVLVLMIATWPNVPWNGLTYGTPVVTAIALTLFFPVSKVVWLTVDVLVRPVTKAELD